MGVIKINTKKFLLLLSRIAPLTFPSPNLDFKAPRKKQDTKCRLVGKFIYILRKCPKRPVKPLTQQWQFPSSDNARMIIACDLWRLWRPRRMARECHWCLSLVSPSFTAGGKALGLEEESALQSPAAASLLPVYVSICTRTEKGETFTILCSWNYKIATQSRAPCNGQFSPRWIRILWFGVRASEWGSMGRPSFLIPVAPTWVLTARQPVEVFLVRLWYQSCLTIPRVELAFLTSRACTMLLFRIYYGQ